MWYPPCLQGLLQKHLYVLVLHSLSFPPPVCHPCSKWQDLPEAERPSSFGLVVLSRLWVWAVWELCLAVFMAQVTAAWNPDVRLPHVPGCSTSNRAFDCALSLTFLVVPFESETWPSCRATQPSWPFRGGGTNLAATGLFFPLVLLCKTLARGSQGSASWLLGCLLVFLGCFACCP